jgi:UDP-glucose 4-epimerase
MQLGNKKVFLIGGAGFIGSHVLDILVAGGNSVTVYDNFSTGRYENIESTDGRSFEVIEGDIRNFDHLKKVMAGHEIVLNMATVCLRVSLNDPFYVESVNSRGVLNVCEASRQNSVERLVYVSSSEAVGNARYLPMDEEHPCNPTTVYGATKLVGEAYARAYYHTHKLPVIIVRPFNAYGPREHMAGKSAEVIPRLVARIKNDLSPIVFGDGNQTRDFSYVTETAEGILRAAQSDDLVGDTINIGFGEGISINRVVKILIQLMSKHDLHIDYPLPDGRPGDLIDQCADIRKARRCIGFNPRISIGEGLKLYLEWLNKQNVDMSPIADEAGGMNW